MKVFLIAPRFAVTATLDVLPVVGAKYVVDDEWFSVQQLVFETNTKTDQTTVHIHLEQA
jgi:hypothetical protein